ncbi:PspC domain-containing protein [Actinomyces viscosus]|uniref:PspC domain-containing protein n=1 Tax=Actinomyces viscosus TaxID=1656 RepID=UPI0028F042F3|nr:PspC domain-containing protein [Actinomyces viscosus]
MTQQQYPGQFSQSARNESDAGSSSGRTGEFGRFRSSLPRRSRKHRILGGVCGGLAEAWDMPVTAVRIGAILACLLPGPMFLVYIAAWCLMLDEPAPTQY